MKKLGKISESHWSEMNRRSQGIKLRKEDSGIRIKIDGTVYYITDEFMAMGDEYYAEYGMEWTSFAFNKMPDGSNIIRGNTDEAGIFGRGEDDDMESGYDVYVLKDYMNLTKEELAKNAFLNLNLDYADSFIQDILKKYIDEVFESHMSDYAMFRVLDLEHTDIDDSMVILYTAGLDYGELDNSVNDEFEDYQLEDARMFLYPSLSGWYENLERDLIRAYENEGWVKSETFEPDMNDSSIPAGTRGLCFVKFDDYE